MLTCTLPLCHWLPASCISTCIYYVFCARAYAYSIQCVGKSERSSTAYPTVLPKYPTILQRYPTHRLQLFQNSFRDHNHTHKPHPNVIGHAPVTTPIVMKISHVNFICAATVAGKSGRKALYSTGGRGQVSENKWISI